MSVSGAPLVSLSCTYRSSARTAKSFEWYTACHNTTALQTKVYQVIKLCNVSTTGWTFCISASIRKQSWWMRHAELKGKTIDFTPYGVNSFVSISWLLVTVRNLFLSSFHVSSFPFISLFSSHPTVANWATETVFYLQIYIYIYIYIYIHTHICVSVCVHVYIYSFRIK
jgi:hypothetical protein